MEEDGIIKFLRHKRRELGGSLQLAKKLGVKDRVVDYWLRGERYPNSTTRKRIMDVFSVTLKDLANFTGSVEPGAVDSPVTLQLLEAADIVARYRKVSPLHVLHPEKYKENGERLHNDG